MTIPARLSTGVAGLDERLGGGLMPGALTVVVGATGIGKTQLGLQFAHAGQRQEGRPGVIFDMTSRGDSQSHREYARRMFQWTLDVAPAERPLDLDSFFAADHRDGDYLHVFDHAGRRVTRRDLGMEAWQDWQAELAKKLNTTIAFLYGNFIRGARRVVIDGVEPADRPSESIQFELFEYIYHQILHKDPDWTARDLLRESFRRRSGEVAAARYDPAAIGCLLLYTTHETLLDRMIERPLDEGDVLANANTVIYLGKIRDGDRLRRGLYIAKHRASACADDVAHYEITDGGLTMS